MGLNSLVFLAEETVGLGDKMSKAGLNTLMGMGIVFLALGFISFVIYLFGFIGKIGTKKEVKEEPVSAPAAPQPVVEEELSNDEELVAVITAAIYAFEAEQGIQVPAGGLFVRSIRRRA